jgi:choline dehydrogenase-like flavoprotein
MQRNSETYDAIVIGSGISGGWAAKELCEKGLKTLVLERGRNVEHVKDYPTMNMDPWDFEHRGEVTKEALAKQPKQGRTGYVHKPDSSHWFVNDIEHPYNEEEGKRFDWIRGYHVGGRSITWGKQSYRLTDLDFEANSKDGIAVDWPVRYKDIAKWYDYVEGHIGVSGQNLGTRLPHFPDGNYLPPMELNCVEEHLQNSIEEKFGDRLLTIGRVAHITGDKSFKGRGKCQFRNRCRRGCPYGAYFSSLSSTLPYAVDTGNMTMRPNSIVHSIIYDKDKGKASGVKVIDSVTKEEIEYSAKVIFCCASTVASTSILLNSKSDRFPNGMGNDSGELGHNMMDHHLGVGASAQVDGFEDKYYTGRRPNGVYIPRFRNLPGQTKRPDYIRGFGYQGGASRENWTRSIKELSIGPAMREDLIKPGPWRIGMGGFGEILPDHDNKMYLDYDKKDQWGLPTVTFDTELKENELNMRKDMKQSAIEMLEAGGFKAVEGFDRETGIGLGIHEMGTARMGRDPKTSVLNGNNQIHDVQNVFVTDGSFMTSAACHNPSLGYMAFTARAVDYAVKQLKKNNL